MYSGFGKLPTDVVHRPSPGRFTFDTSVPYLSRGFDQAMELRPRLLAREEFQPARRRDAEAVGADSICQFADGPREGIGIFQFRVASVDDAGLQRSVGGH